METVLHRVLTPLTLPAEGKADYTTRHSDFWTEHQRRWHQVLQRVLAPDYDVAMFPGPSPIDFLIRGEHGLSFLELKGKSMRLNSLTAHGDGEPSRLIFLEQRDYTKYVDIMWRWYVKVVVLLSFPDVAGILDLRNAQPVSQHKLIRNGGGIEWACFERQFHFQEIPPELWQPEFSDFQWDKRPTYKVSEKSE